MEVILQFSNQQRHTFEQVSKTLGDQNRKHLLPVILQHTFKPESSSKYAVIKKKMPLCRRGQYSLKLKKYFVSRLIHFCLCHFQI